MLEQSNNLQSFRLFTSNFLRLLDLRLASYGVAIFIVASLLARVLTKSWNASLQSRPKSPILEKRSPLKAIDRVVGEWHPIEFKRPAPQPYPDWNISATNPLPYRPFKYGNYHITMGLRTMNWDEWIELDNQFPKFHADKARRIEERGSKCCKTAPEAFDGAIELLEELYVRFHSS